MIGCSLLMPDVGYFVCFLIKKLFLGLLGVLELFLFESFL